MGVITLVRHGQASYMSEDYDKLSPLGERQARKLGEFWVRHRLVFDQVFHGPAQRHIRTMEIACEEVRRAGLPWPEPVRAEDFDEFDAYQMMKTMVPILIETDEKVRALNGSFQANQHGPEAGRLLQTLFEAVAHHWCTGEFETPTVETWAAFRQRVSGALERVRTLTPKGTNTVVFTSGGPIAASVGKALDLHHSKSIEFVWLSRNASFSEFLFSGERFSLSSYNSIPHLDDRALLTYR